MSEDDTFLALSRTPFAIVEQKYREWRFNNEATEALAEEFLKEYGWTFYQFFIEKVERIYKND